MGYWSVKQANQNGADGKSSYGQDYTSQFEYLAHNAGARSAEAERAAAVTPTPTSVFTPISSHTPTVHGGSLGGGYSPGGSVGGFIKGTVGVVIGLVILGAIFGGSDHKGGDVSPSAGANGNVASREAPVIAEAPAANTSPLTGEITGNRSVPEAGGIAEIRFENAADVTAMVDPQTGVLALTAGGQVARLYGIEAFTDQSNFASSAPFADFRGAISSANSTWIDCEKMVGDTYKCFILKHNAGPHERMDLAKFALNAGAARVNADAPDEYATLEAGARAAKKGAWANEE